MTELPPIASILFLAWDRYDLTVRTLTNNLARANYPYELLVCDQGSSDPRVVSFLQGLEPVYLRKNSRNEGVGHSFNQLYLRSKGKHIVLLGNDLECEQDWLLTMVSYLNQVPNSGLCSIDWGHQGVPPTETKFGIPARYLTPQLNRCFGVTAFRRELVDKIGLFHSGYGVYGLEDSDFNERVNRSGFNSFYLPGMSSLHLDSDVGNNTPYRRVKDESLQGNANVLGQRLKQFEIGEGLVELLPERREPL